MSHKLGVYFCPAHDRASDYEYMRQLQPPVIRILMPGDAPTSLVSRVHQTAPNARLALRWWDVDDGGEGNKRGKLDNPDVSAIQDAKVYLGRIEQMENEAREQGNPFPPRSQLLVNALNETPTWEHDMRPAIVAYNRTLIAEMAAQQVPVAALCLAVGHPEEWPPQWDWAKSVIDTILKSPGSVLELHSYWQLEGPNFVWTDTRGNVRKDLGALAGRYAHCPYDVPILIGECGADGRLYDRKPQHTGWRGNLSTSAYAGQLREYLEQIHQDSRIIAALPFLTDYQDGASWGSFDTEEAHLAILEMVRTLPVPPQAVTHLPQVAAPAQPSGLATVPILAHPVSDPRYRIITQAYGPSSIDYSRFKVDGVPLRGHTGIDYGTPVGTQIVAVDAGTVVEVGYDEAGYGRYLKLQHFWGESLYAHLSLPVFGKGASVPRGVVIGLSGNTGNSTAAHLHFGLRIIPFNRRDGMGGFSDAQPYLINTPNPTPTPPALSILALIKAAAQVAGLEWQLLLSLCFAESSLNPAAVNHASGAMGLMQITPSTWAEIGQGDPFDATDNLAAGAKYLVQLLGLVKGDMYTALIAWNWGIGRVLEGLDPPAETIEFANKVIFGTDVLKAVGDDS